LRCLQKYEFVKLKLEIFISEFAHSWLAIYVFNQQQDDNKSLMPIDYQIQS